MSEIKIDLNNCDLEPIHIPGQIQSHGFIIIINKNRIIKFCSENITDFVGVTAQELLEQPVTHIENLLATELHLHFISDILNLGSGISNYDQTNPFEFVYAGENYYLIVSNAGNFTLLEFEKAVTHKGQDIQKLIGKTVSEILGDKDLNSVLKNAAKQVKTIIDYDRVMLYKFAADGHGEVVAESKNDELESWLGLHYPASDIPKQARELYKLNLTRIIADVHSTPSAILTTKSSDLTVDLTNSQLRAVSPIHIQYLKNMGVASSFSISLIYKDELWGLVACHNYTPKFIDYKHRESAQLIGQILSSALEFRQDEENQLLAESLNDSVDKISKYLIQYDNIGKALTTEIVTILDVTKSVGAAFLADNKIIKIGITPNDDQIKALLEWVRLNITESIYSTNHLSAVYPDALAYKDVASGIAVCVIAKELKEYVIWFKPEFLHAVKWAGNPNKPVVINENGLARIHPRESFQVWSEAIVGKSEEWAAEEIKAIIHLKEEINESVLIKSAAIRELNKKLKIAYDELDAFSYTISHDLKNPLSAIRSYAQLLMRSKNVADRDKDFATRIEDRSVKMTEMINEVLNHSRVGRSELIHQVTDMEILINDIVTDLKAVYDHPDLEIIVGTTPPVSGDKTMLSQVFSNLIGNAVKYSQKSERPKITLNGIESETEVFYTITDNGIGIADAEIDNVFDLFQRMDNVADIEGSGVGLAIVKRIVDRHKGRIWLESELEKGSAFHIAFPKI